MVRVTRELADYASKTRYEDLPIEVVNQAKKLVLDTIGVTLAGWKEDYFHRRVGKKIVAFVKKIGGTKECTVLGDGARVPRFSAALANGTLAKIYGQDETYRHAGGGHIAAAFIPSALTAAELEATDGKRLIVSVVVGYDMYARVLEGLGYSHSYRGFNTQQTLGTLAAAVATGKIFGLNSEQMKNAIGLAANLSSGLNEMPEYDILGLSCGWSSQNGLLASELARENFIGPEAPLEGKRGLFRAMGHELFFKPWRVLEKLGEDYWIMRAGFKFQSGCRQTHQSLDALEKIINEHRIAPEDVEKIVVRTSFLSPHSILTGEPFLNTEPNDHLSAAMSIPFNLAVRFFDRSLGPDRFSKFKEPAIRRLCKKVEVITDVELDKFYPEKMGAKVEVITKSDEKFSSSVDYPKGEPENPLTKDELQTKFRRLASLAISKEAIEDVLAYIERLEKVEDVRQILGLLHV